MHPTARAWVPPEAGASSRHRGISGSSSIVRGRLQLTSCRAPRVEASQWPLPLVLSPPQGPAVYFFSVLLILTIKCRAVLSCSYSNYIFMSSHIPVVLTLPLPLSLLPLSCLSLISLSCLSLAICVHVNASDSVSAWARSRVSENNKNKYTRPEFSFTISTSTIIYYHTQYFLS